MKIKTSEIQFHSNYINNYSNGLSLLSDSNFQYVWSPEGWKSSIFVSSIYGKTANWIFSGETIWL
jgi:hypothetical protein